MQWKTICFSWKSVDNFYSHVLYTDGFVFALWPVFFCCVYLMYIFFSYHIFLIYSWWLNLTYMSRIFIENNCFMLVNECHTGKNAYFFFWRKERKKVLPVVEWKANMSHCNAYFRAHFDVFFVYACVMYSEAKHWRHHMRETNYMRKWICTEIGGFLDLKRKKLFLCSVHVHMHVLHERETEWKLSKYAFFGCMKIATVGSCGLN